jgi:hypothetical protein
MTKLRERMNGKGAPTQSQPQAASLTLSACNAAIQIKNGSRRIFQHVNLFLNYCAIKKNAVGLR